MNKVNFGLQQEFACDAVQAYRTSDQQSECLDLEGLRQKLDQDPQGLLYEIRISKRFLRMADDAFQQLCQFVSEDSEQCRLEARAWRRIRAQERAYWQKVEAEFPLLRGKRLPLADILLGVVLWLEDARWESNFKEGIEEGTLRAIYQTFVSLYLPAECSSPDVSPEDMCTRYITILKGGEAFAAQLVDAVAPLLAAIASWREYYDGVLMLYCFDHTSYVEEAPDGIYLCQSQEDYTAWAKDGSRYQSIKNYYYEICEGQLPIATQQLLLDAGLTEKDSCLAFYGNMALWSGRRKETYTNLLKHFPRPYASSLLEAMKALLFVVDQKEGRDTFPYELHTKESFNHLFNSAVGSEGQGYSGWLRRLAFKFDEDFEFCRFKPLVYDVYKKPFVQLGRDSYFSPMIFFADIDWCIQALSNELDYLNSNRSDKAGRNNSKKSPRQKQREQSKRLEQHLFDAIQRTVKTITKSASEEALREVLGQGNGDIDLFFEDEHTSLLIQVKSSSLRLDLERAHYERVQSEQKGYEQLAKAERCLINTDTEFKPQKKIVRWLVSTSFEGINRKPDDINGINKVNYFELLAILQLEQPSSLDGLIEMVNSDYVLANCLGQELPVRQAFRYPL